MGFTKKTWKNRIAEYINRRLITNEDGSTNLVTVARDEGTISQEGDAFNAANMNDLEDRIAAEFDEINQSLTNFYVNYKCLLSESGTQNVKVESLSKYKILHLGMIHRDTEQAVCEFSIPCVLFALKTNHQLQITVNGIQKYCNIEYIDDNTIKINCDSDFYAVVYGL